MEANEQKIAENQMRFLYAFAFFWMFMVIIPVLVPFFLAGGMNMQDVFMLQVSFGLVTMALEVPSGYLADLWGRKQTLLLGALLNGLGYTWLFFASTWWDFFIFEVILGAAMAMASGTDLALMYAWLKKVRLNREAATQMMARRQFFSVGAESIASILGGVLVVYGFGWVRGAQMIAGWLPFLIVLRLREAPYEKMSRHEHRKNLTEVLHFLFRKDPLINLIFWNLTVWSLATFVAVWILQKYWQEVGIPLVWFGLLWAGFNLTVGLTGHLVAPLEKKFGSRFLLVILALLPPLAYFLMAFYLGWIGVLAGLGFQFSRGITQVLLRDAFNWRLPEQFRATANSLASMAFRLGFSILGPVAGLMLDHQGLKTALIAQGVIFLMAFWGVMVPLWLRLPNHLKPTKK